MIHNGQGDIARSIENTHPLSNPRCDERIYYPLILSIHTSITNQRRAIMVACHRWIMKRTYMFLIAVSPHPVDSAIQHDLRSLFSDNPMLNGGKRDDPLCTDVVPFQGCCRVPLFACLHSNSDHNWLHDHSKWGFSSPSESASWKLR